jgi:hypothetical protein
MTADFMSRGYYPLNGPRISLRHPSQYKKGGFGSSRVQKLKYLIELMFDPGGKIGPSTFVYSCLDFRWVKVLLNIDGNGVEHAPLEPYALRCLRKKTAMEYSIDTNPSTAVSALRCNIIPSRSVLASTSVAIQ